MAVSAFTQLGTPVNSNTTTQTTISSGSVVLPTGQSGGQAVLAVFLLGPSGTTTAETWTVQDGSANAFTTAGQADSAAGSTAAHTVVAYRNYPATTPGVDTTITVTATLSAAVNMRFAVMGYVTGHDSVNPLDVSGSNFGIVSTTSIAVSTSASAAAGGTAVAVWSGTGTSPPATSGYPGTWTGIQNLGDATRARAAAFMQTAVASSGVVTAPTLTFATSQTTPAYSVVVFKAPGGPVNTVAPAITGSATLGSTLTCDNGTWSNTPTGYTYLWQRSSNSGSAWNNVNPGALDGGATASTHTVVGYDVGCILRCVVTATNAAGSSSANSNSTSQVAPTSGTPSYRRVSFPATQSDNQTHTVNLSGPVLPNETLVLIASTSIGNISGDMGAITDPNGNIWTRDHDSAFGGPGTTTGHITQAFSAQNGVTKLQIGATITAAIKQSTVIGAHAANSATIHVTDVSIFDAGGSNLNIGAGASPAGGTVTYTGIDVPNNLLTGCGNHSALSGGETIIYHGQSPYWVIYALNPGDGSATRLTFDGAAGQHAVTPTPSAGPITTVKGTGVAFTLGVLGGADTNHWMTPGSGWAVDFAGFQANHLTGGAADADGITYGGESGYKMGVETRTYSAAGTSITGNFTSDAGAGAFQDAMVVAYGFTPPANSSLATATRITGQNSLSLANDVRLNPQGVSNQTFDTKITGQDSSNSATDVRLFGQAGLSQINDAWIIGLSTSNRIANVNIEGIDPNQPRTTATTQTVAIAGMRRPSNLGKYIIADSHISR